LFYYNCNGYNFITITVIASRQVVILNPEYDKIVERLRDADVRLSHHRLAILRYLCENTVHPTADQIYSSLHESEPTLSKTTVYNNLNTFINAGILRLITIENNETRYDIDVEDHGHFRCDVCGKVYDFPFRIGDEDTEALEGYLIKDRNVYFTGICPGCRKKDPEK